MSSVIGNKSHCGERLSGFAQTSVKIEEVHPTLFYQVSRVGGGVERGEKASVPNRQKETYFFS